MLWSTIIQYLKTDALYYKTSGLQRKAESYFQHTKSTFSFDTRQSMKARSLLWKLGSVRCLAIIRLFLLWRLSDEKVFLVRWKYDTAFLCNMQYLHWNYRNIRLKAHSIRMWSVLKLANRTRTLTIDFAQIAKEASRQKQPHKLGSKIC